MKTINVNPVAVAIAESQNAISEARSGIDMRRRKAWIFVAEDTLIEQAAALEINETLTMEQLALRHCGKPETTAVRRGTNLRGRALYAVWNGEEPEPTFEPEF